MKSDLPEMGRARVLVCGPNEPMRDFKMYLVESNHTNLFQTFKKYRSNEHLDGIARLFVVFWSVQALWCMQFLSLDA